MQMTERSIVKSTFDITGYFTINRGKIYSEFLMCQFCLVFYISLYIKYVHKFCNIFKNIFVVLEFCQFIGILRIRLQLRLIRYKIYKNMNVINDRLV